MAMTFRLHQCPKWQINQYGKDFKRSITHLFRLSTFVLSYKPAHRLCEICVLGKKTFSYSFSRIHQCTGSKSRLNPRKSQVLQLKQFMKLSPADVMWLSVFCLCTLQANHLISAILKLALSIFLDSSLVPCPYHPWCLIKVHKHTQPLYLFK